MVKTTSERKASTLRLQKMARILYSYAKIQYLLFFGNIIMIGGIHSALSGLAAAGVQTANTANNVANLNSDGFKKGRVLQAEQRPQGVSTIVEKVDTSGAYAIEDTSEGQALIEKSNVDLSEEMPQMMVNQHSYNANLKTLQVADDMTASLLDTKA